MTKVLVTGGTGFIGSILVNLLLAANYNIRVLVHDERNSYLLENLDVEIINGDVTHPESIEKAVKGCAIVFHLASVYAFYPFWEKKAEELYKINVQGTINMLQAAFKNKVDRFIYTSSIATINKKSDTQYYDETAGFNPKCSIHYARSKYLAEQEVIKFHKKGLPAIILNPAIVIGEKDYKPTPSGEVIVKFLNQNYPVYFNTVWSTADVDDVARSHIAAITKGKIGERYILCNKEHYSLKEIFRFLEEISKVRAPTVKIPYSILLPSVYIEEFLSCKFFKKKPLMSTEGVKFCKRSLRYDNSKAVAELAYTTTPFTETLSKAVCWYRDNGYIKQNKHFGEKRNTTLKKYDKRCYE